MLHSARPCRVTGEEGATEAERRIRSFPVLEDLSEEEEEAAAAAAPGQGPGSPAVGRAARQRLGRQRLRELSRAQAAQQAAQQQAGGAAPAAAAAPAAPVAAAAAEAQDGLVEDYHSEEEEERQGQQGGAAAAEAAARSPEDPYADMPSLASDEGESFSEEEERAAAQGRGARRRPPRAAAPLPARLAHADMLLLAAVCVGDLACRFLGMVGGSEGGSPQAAALAAAERLRALTEVPTVAGAARDALVVSWAAALVF